jgi:hypothetical protein
MQVLPMPPHASAADESSLVLVGAACVLVATLLWHLGARCAPGSAVQHSTAGQQVWQRTSSLSAAF